MDAIELEFDNHCYLYLYLYLVEKMEIIVVGIGKWDDEKCEGLEFIKYGVMCQSPVRAGGAEGANIFSVFVCLLRTIFRSYCFAKRNSKLGAMGKESDGKRLQLWPFNSPSLGPPLSITHRGRCVS